MTTLELRAPPTTQSAFGRHFFNKRHLRSHYYWIRQRLTRHIFRCDAWFSFADPRRQLARPPSTIVLDLLKKR